MIWAAWANSYGGLMLTTGVDHLGPPFAFGFGLPRHAALEIRRQQHVFHFDRGDLYAPRFRVPVDDLAQAVVDPFAMRQQFVQFGLAQHAS